MTDWIIILLAALVTSLGFCVVFNVRGRVIAPAAIGGMLTWVIYVALTRTTDNLYLPYFGAAMALAFYAELMSPRFKAPATVFLIIGLLPLVPGRGIYRTMVAFMEGNGTAFFRRGIETLGISGTLALALLLASSLTRFIRVLRHRNRVASRRL